MHPSFGTPLSQSGAGALWGRGVPIVFQRHISAILSQIEWFAECYVAGLMDLNFEVSWVPFPTPGSVFSAALAGGRSLTACVWGGAARIASSLRVHVPPPPNGHQATCISKGRPHKRHVTDTICTTRGPNPPFYPPPPPFPPLCKELCPLRQPHGDLPRLTCFCHAPFCNGVALLPSRVSFLHALFLAKTGGGLIMGLTGFNNGYRVREGGGAAAALIAQELGPAVLLNTAVAHIDHSRPGSVTVTTTSGTKLMADAVIVTGSPTGVRRIAFTPALPHATRRLLEGMHQGNSVRLSVVYPAPWWRAQGLSGSIGDLAADSNVYYAFDSSPADSSCGVIQFHLCGEVVPGSNQSNTQPSSTPVASHTGSFQAVGIACMCMNVWCRVCHERAIPKMF